MVASQLVIELCCVHVKLGFLDGLSDDGGVHTWALQELENRFEVMIHHFLKE